MTDTDFFIGYQPCAGSDAASPKMPLPFWNPRTGKNHNKFKGLADEEYLTLHEARQFQNYGGKMAEGFVIVDIDNMREANILLDIVKALNVKTHVIRTTKGMHFYFRKPENLKDSKQKIKTLLRIGIEGDFLFGRERFIVLKMDGKERECLIKCDEPEELPFWLLPIPKSDAAKRFSEVHQGERDNSLLAYQVLLAAQGLNPADIKTVITIIGKMVLPEPVSDSDIERLTRPEAVEGAERIAASGNGIDPSLKRFTSGKRIKYDDYARYLIDKLHIIRHNNQLAVYKDGIYVRVTNERNSISSYVARYEFPNLKDSEHTEILKAIKRQIIDETEPAPLKYIPFKNCYVDVTDMDLFTGEFASYPHSPDVVFYSFIPVDYTPDADTTFVKKVLMTYANSDEKKEAILEEIVGACMYRSASVGIDPKAFILTGGKSNGKSTFLNMLQSVLGNENISGTPPQSFAERFALSNLADKLANIVADLNEDTIRCAGLFKSIVSGDPLEAEEKYGGRFTFNPYATMIFSCNNLPVIKDDSGAVLRRLCIIQFDKEFDSATADRRIGEKLRSEENRQALVKLGLEGLHRLLAKGEFTQSEKCEEIKEEYSLLSSDLRAFVAEYKADGSEFEGHTPSEIYIAYEAYCEEYKIHKNQVLPMNKLSSKLMKLENLTSKVVRDGARTKRIYIKNVTK